MKPLTVLFATAFLALINGIAIARDIGPEEAAKLRAAGIIQAFEQLDAAALTRHPGAKINDTELDDEYGKHVYQVELTDAQGVDWDVDVDAATGNVLKDHQDR
jgi:uncharacterized membrane protein YkoI